MTKYLLISLASMLAIVSTAAQAHPRLISSTPRAGATVSSPTAIGLTFSEKLIGQFTGGEVVMAGMSNVGHSQSFKIGGFTKTLGRDGKSFQMSRAKPLAPGNYVVTWHAVSVDTHRVQGKLGFRVK